MFPITNYNFLFGGFATIAVTVGYTCVKKRASNYLSVSMSGSPSKVEHPTKSGLQRQTIGNNADVLVEQQSPIRPLKRKHVEDEDNIKAGYPYNLASIYPNKRSRTPSSESESAQSPRTPKPVETPEVVIVMQEECFTKLDIKEVAIKPSAEELQPSPIGESVMKSESIMITFPAAPTSEETKVEPAQGVERVFSTPLRKSGRGFAAFAGTSSPFSVSSASDGVLKSAKSPPIWSQVAADKLVDKQDTTFVSETSKKEDEEPSSKEGDSTANALEAEVVTPAAKSDLPHLSGEEDEEVITELKGAKVFIKRGVKDFTTGMLGHIKLLTNKNEETSRLLFRREPLWSVSMNIRLLPSMRCTFNTEDCVLRVIHKEVADSDSESSSEATSRVTVYAIKRGRIPKASFQAFAETVIASAHLKA